MTKTSHSRRPSDQLDWLVESRRSERDQLNDELRQLRYLQRSLRAMEDRVKSQSVVIAEAHKALKYARGLPMAPHSKRRIDAVYAACANELGLKYDCAVGDMPDMPAQGSVCLACAR